MRPGFRGNRLTGYSGAMGRRDAIVSTVPFFRERLGGAVGCATRSGGCQVIPAIVATLVIGVFVGVIIGSALTARFGEVSARKDREIQALEDRLARYEAAMPRLRELDAMDRFDARMEEERRGEV